MAAGEERGSSSAVAWPHVGMHAFSRTVPFEETSLLLHVDDSRVISKNSDWLDDWVTSSKRSRSSLSATLVSATSLEQVESNVKSAKHSDSSMVQN